MYHEVRVGSHRLCRTEWCRFQSLGCASECTAKSLDFRKWCQNSVETLTIAFKSHECSGTNIYLTSRKSTHNWTFGLPSRVKGKNGEPCWKGQLMDTVTSCSSPKRIWWAKQPIRGISLTDGLSHRFYMLSWSKRCRQPTKAARWQRTAPSSEPQIQGSSDLQPL